MLVPIPANSGDATTAVRRALLRSFERALARAKWLPVGEIRRGPKPSAVFGVTGDVPPAAADVAHLGPPWVTASGPRGPR